jgi:hypothetical protein
MVSRSLLCNLLGTFLLSMPVLPSHALTLVENGEPKAKIVLPSTTEYDRWVETQPDRVRELVLSANPEADDKFIAEQLRRALKAGAEAGDDEKLAAEELQSILRQISGGELAVVTAGEGPIGGPSIVLGGELARQLGFGEELDALDRDGFIIRTKGDLLILAGQRSRGTLFAAYTFLESLGCRWVMPGPFGEIYPELPTIETQLNVTENPGHRERYFWCTYGHQPEYPRWTLRNKGTFVRAPGDQIIEQAHGLSNAIRWASEREEFAAPPTVTDDGTASPPRVREDLLAYTLGGPNPVLPNISNPDSWKMYADYYRDFFRNNPLKEYATLSAEDGIMLDQRAQSLPLASNEFDWTYGFFSSTDQLWHLHNRIIEGVGEDFPDRKFGILVYANNQMPPRMEKLHPNMALIFAPLGISPLTHVRDENEKTNVAWREWLEDWMRLARAAGAETYYYDYEPIGFSWNLAMICPRWEIIGRNYPYFHSLGLTGHTSQGHDDWASTGLNNYLMQRLYWNPQQDYKEIIRDYCEARFGAAAGDMFEYYELLGDAPLRTPALYGNEHWANHLVLTPELRAQARAILQKAIASADTEQARAHVRTVVDTQEMTDAMCDAIELSAETGDFAAASAMMEKAFAVKDRLNTIYPNFVNEHRMNPESTYAFETGGQYNLFRGFAERINNAKASIVLPRVWKGSLDTNQAAYASGLHLPDADVSGLEELDTTIMPDVKYETQREPAAFFYRTEIDVPKSFTGKKTTLFMPGLIAKALEVWVNGTPVIFDNSGNPETIRRGPQWFWLDYNTVEEVDVTDLIRPGETNTIAFRTFKSADVGGSFRRIFLLAE